jgi:hypothetical protein
MSAGIVDAPAPVIEPSLGITPSFGTIGESDSETGSNES